MIDESKDAASAPVIAGVMTAFLRVGKCVDHGSSAVLMTTIVLYALKPNSALSIATALITVLVALIEKYYSWRIALDAELFALLRHYPAETSTFDATLATCLGRQTTQTTQTSRTLQSRWSGAKRLMQCQILFFSLQIFILMGSIMTGSAALAEIN